MAGTITIRSGDTETLTLTFVDSAGDAVNLTGDTVDFKIAKSLSKSDGTAIYSTSVTSHTNAAGGITTVTISEDLTKAFPVGVFLWQTRIIDSGGAVSSSDVGVCRIEENLIDDEA